MHRRSIASICLIGLLIGSSGVPVVIGADSDYSLSLSESIDTPPQIVPIQGEEHTVSSVGRSAPDSSVSVTVSAPTDATYDVLLYNGNSKIEQSKDGSGDHTVKFDMNGYEPGSYLLAIYKDGDYKAVQPLVVGGYTVTIEDVRSQVDADATMTVTVTADKRESVEDPDSVTVILATDEHHEQITASKTASQTYEATLSLDTFSTGDASVYAVVQGSDTAFQEDRKELLGISDATTVSIEEPATTTPSTSTTTSSAPATTSSTPATTSSAPATNTPPSSTAVDTTTHSDPSHPPSSTDTTTTPRPTTTSPVTSASSDKPLTTTSSTDDAVITPIQSTTTGTQTTPSSDIPGFGFTAIAMALLGILYLIRRQ